MRTHNLLYVAALMVTTSMIGCGEESPAEFQTDEKEPTVTEEKEPTVTEEIIYAVNADYAQLNPNWQNAAQEIITFANQVLAQNTDKRYEIVAFKTFDSAKWHQLGTDPAYAYDNGYGGTTVLHWVELPTSKVPLGEPLANVAGYSFINGVRYQQLYLVESHPEYSALLGNASPNFVAWMQVFLHELGHTMGLSVPDWYFYEFDDLSGAEPKLPRFNLRMQYPQDPMSAWAESGYRYTDFNAAVINKNLRHEKSFLEIQRIASTQVKVMVRDGGGNPVSDATVQVYGAKKGCFYCQDVTQNPLLLTTTTSSSGEAIVTAPSVEWSMSEDQSTTYIGMIVKIRNGDLHGAEYVIGQQMQQHKFLTGSDVFQLFVTIVPR